MRRVLALVAMTVAGCEAPQPDGFDPSAPYVEPPVNATEVFGLSWVDTSLGAMPRPLESELPLLDAEGVDLLVTLTESPLDPAWFGGTSVDSLHIPIEDFEAPTMEQAVAYVAEVERATLAGQRVVTHCLAGRGRTGTMVAIWYVHNGMSPEDAIARIRELRPGSIETEEQELAVHQYAHL